MDNLKDWIQEQYKYERQLMDMQNLVFQYFDKQYRIEDDLIFLEDMNSNQFQLYTVINDPIRPPSTTMNGCTQIDLEVSEMFGTRLLPFFWKWADERIGYRVRIKFKNGLERFTYHERVWDRFYRENEDYRYPSGSGIPY